MRYSDARTGKKYRLPGLMSPMRCSTSSRDDLVLSPLPPLSRPSHPRHPLRGFLQQNNQHLLYLQRATTTHPRQQHAPLLLPDRGLQAPSFLPIQILPSSPPASAPSGLANPLNSDRTRSIKRGTRSGWRRTAGRGPSSRSIGPLLRGKRPRNSRGGRSCRLCGLRIISADG